MRDHHWASFWLALLLAYALVRVSDRLPEPASAAAPASAFSEARARVLLDALVARGPRVPGSEAYLEAANLLARTLADIPGVEVEIVDHRGSSRDPDVPQLVRSYRTLDVLARLPGREREALLLSAHFDSPGESPGAADDGVGVVTAVETLRALAAGPPLEHTIVVNLNGAEESGTLGAEAFLSHAWRSEVIAAINLEATPRGRTLAFEVGPNSAWLLDAYARAVTRPHASGVAEDLFRTGLLGHYTDFRVYGERAGIPTVDLATYGDFWAYHTSLDVPERIEPGVVQHMGDCTLELARGLDTAPDPHPGRALYGDVLGRATLHASPSTARVLALLALVLTLALGVRARLVWSRGLRALARIALAMLSALALPVLLGLVVAELLGLPQRWYAEPAWGVLGFVLTSVAGACGALACTGPRTPSLAEREELVLAALLVWSCAALLLACLAASTSLLLLALALPAALVWSLARARRGWSWWWSGSLLLGMLLIVQQIDIVATMFIAEAGLLELPFAFDPILATTLALPTLLLLPGLAPLVPARTDLRSATLLVAGAALLATLLSSTRTPYTPERPKRVFLAHGEDAGGAWLAAGPYDAVGLPPQVGEALGLLPDAREVLWFSTTLAAPAEATGLPDPRPRLIELERRQGRRRFRLELELGPASDVLLRAPADSLAAWSPTTPPPHASDGDILLWVVWPDSAFSLELEPSGSDALELELTIIDALGRSPALERAIAALPTWTTAHARRLRRLRIELPGE